MMWIAITGWAAAMGFVTLWLHAVKLWAVSDYELQYLKWRCRMRDKREGTHWL